MGRNGRAWLLRGVVVLAGLLAAAVITLVCVKLVEWEAQVCLLCKPSTAAGSWLCCYFAIGVGGAAMALAPLLLFLPIWPQVQSVLAWLTAGLFSALGALLTTYSLPAYSDSDEGAWILAVFVLCWASVVAWTLVGVERCCALQTDRKLGSLTKLQSMKSADLEAQLDAPKRTPHGEGCWWSVALKAPLDPRLGLTGVECQYRDADADPSQPGWSSSHGLTIDRWLLSHLGRDAKAGRAWSGWALYSDEPPSGGARSWQAGPGGPDPARHGRCKGVVVWNKSRVGMLVHSVPRWPPGDGFLAEEGAVPPLPAEHDCLSLAQSFAFVTMPLAKLRELHSQLNLMQACIYASHQDGIYAMAPGAPPPVQLSRMVIGGGIYHVAKRSDWKGDIYADGLAEKTVFGLCGGPVHVQSWREGGDGLEPNIDADNVQQCRWASSASYSADQNRGVWAVSAFNAKHRWSLVGDLSRVEAHMARGGGGIVIRDPALWKTFLSSVEDWDGPFGK